MNLYLINRYGSKFSCSPIPISSFKLLPTEETHGRHDKELSRILKCGPATVRNVNLSVSSTGKFELMNPFMNVFVGTIKFSIYYHRWECWRLACRSSVLSWSISSCSCTGPVISSQFYEFGSCYFLLWACN